MKTTNRMYIGQTPFRIDLVEKAISEASNVSVDDMRSHARDRQFVDARMAVWFIVHDFLGYGFHSIAEVYDRDHTTIVHGVHKIRKGDENVREKIISGVKKRCPKVFVKPTIEQNKTVENWQF